jgi:hypothetical protein
MEKPVTTETGLADRQRARLLDIVMGRNDDVHETCHYLVVRRAPFSGAVEHREIEQYRDLERLVANAADCGTGDRDARVLGAFTATYREDRLVGLTVLGDLPARIESHAARPCPLSALPWRRNLLRGES